MILNDSDIKGNVIKTRIKSGELMAQYFIIISEPLALSARVICFITPTFIARINVADIYGTGN